MNVVELNQRFEKSDGADIIAWAVDTFMPKLAATSSFQTQSVALLHIISQTHPEIPVLFVDTGYHFPETLAFRDQLIEQLDIRVFDIKRSEEEALQDKQDQPPYLRDVEYCCFVHKVAPMQKALAGLDAWISGIRRDQTANRANAQPVEQLSNGKYKINPLVNWTEHDLWRYMGQHSLPTHPLFSQGYASVGCAPCTRPIQAGDDARAGRWVGSSKTECGLHTEVLSENNQSES